MDGDSEVGIRVDFDLPGLNGFRGGGAGGAGGPPFFATSFSTSNSVFSLSIAALTNGVLPVRQMSPMHCFCVSPLNFEHRAVAVAFSLASLVHRSPAGLGGGAGEVQIESPPIGTAFFGLDRFASGLSSDDLQLKLPHSPITEPHLKPDFTSTYTSIPRSTSAPYFHGLMYIFTPTLLMLSVSLPDVAVDAVIPAGLLGERLSKWGTAKQATLVNRIHKLVQTLLAPSISPKPCMALCRASRSDFATLCRDHNLAGANRDLNLGVIRCSVLPLVDLHRACLKADER